MNDEDLKKLVESNAKAIQALTEDVKTYQREAQLDRARLYQVMADLARTQSRYYERLTQDMTDLARTQSSHYERLESHEELISILSRRQGEIVEILQILARKDRE